MDKANHVKQQLLLRPDRNATEKSDDLWICCPYHSGGREKTPSLRINMHDGKFPVGTFHCYACKVSGSWNKLANELSLDGFKARDKVNDVYAFSFVDEAKPAEVKVPVIPEYADLQRWPRDRRWRRIDAAVVRAYGGCAPRERYTGDWLVGRNFIYFPVTVSGQQVGGVYARRRVNAATKAAGQPSYINTSGAWIKQQVFGYDVAKRRSRQPLWIVEGPRDCMKVHQMGGRAIALLGAYVSPRKLRLIEMLDPPSVILATDPDDAGQKALDALRKGLDMFPQYLPRFPAGKDPGDFTPRRYARMLERLGL